MHTFTEKEIVFLYGSASASTMDKEENGADVLLPQATNKCRQRRFMGFGLAFYSLHRLPLRGGCFFLIPFSYCDDDQGGRERKGERHRAMICMHVCLPSLALPFFYSSHLQGRGLILFPRSYFLLSPLLSPSLVAPFSRGGGGGLKGGRPASLPYLYGY